MTAALKPIAHWWNGLSPREHLMLGGLGVILALLILWYAMAAPLLVWRAEGIDTLEAARRDAAFVESAIAEAATLGTAQPKVTTGDLRASISESALARGVPISRLQPEAAGGINVWVEGITPSLLYAWLAEIEKTYGIGTARAVISRAADGSGLTAQLLLTGTGS